LGGQFTVTKEQIMQFKVKLRNLSRQSYTITNYENRYAQQVSTCACMCYVQYSIISWQQCDTTSQYNNINITKYDISNFVTIFAIDTN
jgi:hypothetical protein